MGFLTIISPQIPSNWNKTDTLAFSHKSVLWWVNTLTFIVDKVLGKDHSRSDVWLLSGAGAVDSEHGLKDN